VWQKDFYLFTIKINIAEIKAQVHGVWYLLACISDYLS
jgi:hypothetical protein